MYLLISHRPYLSIGKNFAFYQFLFLLAFSLTILEASFFKATAQSVENDFQPNTLPTSSTLGKYGKWCGAGHGGYQDCCDGLPCPACVEDLKSMEYSHCNTSDCDPMIPSMNCINQCTPVDDLDLACSFHDLCTFQFDATVLCHSPYLFYCQCNCLLVKRSTEVKCTSSACSIEQFKILQTFPKLQCWHYENSSQEALTCHDSYPLDSFC